MSSKFSIKLEINKIFVNNSLKFNKIERQL
jgi:hypothetical protein